MRAKKEEPIKVYRLEKTCTGYEADTHSHVCISTTKEGAMAGAYDDANIFPDAQMQEAWNWLPDNSRGEWEVTCEDGTVIIYIVRRELLYP